MAQPVPTVQQVKDTSISGEFDLVADATIIDIRDGEVVDLYNAADVCEHSQWTRAVALHTAHILHVLLVLEAANGDWGALAATTSRTLQGVGARGKAAGALTPADAADYMKVPSAYLMRLTRILETFPVSMHTVMG